MLVRFERGMIQVQEEACIQEKEESRKRQRRMNRKKRKKRKKRKCLRITLIVKATLSSSVTGSRLFLSRLQQTHLPKQDHGAFYPAVPGPLFDTVYAPRRRRVKEIHE